MHYFDYAASCPPFPEALAEFDRVSREFFGNPSSAHSAGVESRDVMEKMKTRLAEFCSGEGYRLILTSGGTEANNLVVKGLMEKHRKGRLLLAEDVHESVWFARDLYRKRVDVIPLEKDGRLSLERIGRSIGKNTLLLSAVHVCNETGVVHDIAAYSRLCRKYNVLFHCDGAQALGHFPVGLTRSPVDFYSFSSHKFGGVRGGGGVFLRAGELLPQIAGGGQEEGLRAGTENPAALAAAVTALSRNVSSLEKESSRLKTLTTLFLDRLASNLRDFKLNSHQDGLPGLISVSFPGTLGSNLVEEMNLKGFALSSGSACHANDIRPSRIIKALGRSQAEALGTVRISMGYGTTAAETEKLASVLGEVVERQRMLA